MTEDSLEELSTEGLIRELETVAESGYSCQSVSDLMAVAAKRLTQRTNERDEALENQRRTYANSVELAKYLEKAGAELATLKSELATLHREQAALVERWRNEAKGSVEFMQTRELTDVGEARHAAFRDTWNRCADELAALLSITPNRTA